MRQTLTSGRAALLSALIPTLALFAASAPALAAECPGNPNALGVSRTIVVDPREHPRVGTMQYGETLPLEDHEVVLTFDDGPLPAHTNPILDILASECVKATFFMVGKMATAFPKDVRRVYEAGHTIGTHTESHPMHFGSMPPERIATEIDDGIKHVSEGLGDPALLAPFFRVPGLRRSEVVESALSQRGIMTWSADFPADDWRHITSAQVINYALTRLEAKGKGVLLLHDIQPRTQAALPIILQQLKVRGYRIVHVVPATPDRPKTVTEPSQWVPAWIHGSGVAAKSSGYVFGAADIPPRRAARSVRSVWLASQPSHLRAATLLLERPIPDHILVANRPVMTPTHVRKSYARLPGSWPIRTNDTFRATAATTDSTRTEAHAAPDIR